MSLPAPTREREPGVARAPRDRTWLELEAIAGPARDRRTWLEPESPPRPRARDEAARHRRERERHLRRVQIRRRRAVAILVLLCTLTAIALSAGASGRSDPAAEETARQRAAAPAAPSPAQVERAAAFARARAGNAAFAVVDTDGRMRGLDARRPYRSVSLVKAMILVAYLDLAARRGTPLTPGERSLLQEMIRRSDNRSATRLVNSVGTSGLVAVARRAGMRATRPVARPWGLTPTTAEDQARLFARIEALVPPGYRSYARQLLAGVVPAQRWGIPAAAPAGSSVLFKGGWLPAEGGWMVHQAARVETPGRGLSLAVMTDADPSQRYGEETIRGIAARLLR